MFDFKLGLDIEATALAGNRVAGLGVAGLISSLASWDSWVHRSGVALWDLPLEQVWLEENYDCKIW